MKRGAIGFGEAGGVLLDAELYEAVVLLELADTFFPAMIHEPGSIIKSEGYKHLRDEIHLDGK